MFLIPNEDVVNPCNFTSMHLIFFLNVNNERVSSDSEISKYFNKHFANVLLTVPRRYFFCGSFMFLFCLVFAMSLCAFVYMCFVVTCWERADLLALVCGLCCEFVTFPLVSWVRCGT